MDKQPAPEMFVIDATHQLVGRLATQAARAALHGKQVIILNSEKAVISGAKGPMVQEYRRRFAMGAPREGPFIHRQPDRLVRRVIRGMLPYKMPRGRDAFTRTMCYIGVPSQFKDLKPIRFPEADVGKLPTTRWMTIGELSKELGGTWHE